MYKIIMLVLFASLITFPAFSQILLQQSTSPVIVVGPVVSAANPATAITSNAGWTIQAYKNGTLTTLVSHTITHSYNGFFLFYLNTTDTNTTGRLKITFTVPSALIFWHDYLVVPADVYAFNVTAAYQRDSFADQVWNEYLSGHTVASTMGKYISDINTNAYNASVSAANAYAKVDTEIATIDGIVDAILVDTGTTLDNYIDTEIAAILLDTGTTLEGKINTIDSNASLAAARSLNTYNKVDTEIATIDTNVDAILVDTGTTLEGKINTINTNTANTYGKVDNEIATIDGIVDAILVDTGTTIPGTITTIDNEIATIDAKINAIDDYVDTEVEAILEDTGTTLNAALGDIDTSLNQADINLICAGNDIIPASGMTLPKFTYSREGDASRALIARGLSYSANQPGVLFRLVDGSGTEITHAMEDSFTWAAFAMQAPDITGATPYAHLFKWQISDSVPDGWYQMYTVVESNSRAIGTVNTIILSPTPTIDESGLVARSTFNEFVADVSASFRSIRQGHPAEFTAYRNSTELTRATPSVSSLSSRHAAAGSLYGLRSRFYDPFSNEYVSTDWLYDYDETYGASGRGKAFEATVNSVSETAVLEDVTLTTSGGIE
jgi:hypothetical protein